MIKIVLKKKLASPNGSMELNVDLKIKEGQLTTLYGESGAGKTSILRMISGLMNADVGFISVNDQIWLDTEKRINLKPQKRKIGFVFQDYALFPNMTVHENLMYALDKGYKKESISEMIEMMELGDLQHRHPSHLSGGQKQRVALARALVRKPDILLLDEPLSALDMKMRSKLQDYMLKMHRQLNLTTILISHDIGEIFKMSDYILMINDGKIIKEGKPLDVFSNHLNSNDYQMAGKIIHIQKEGVVYFVTVLVGIELIKILCTAIHNFSIGDNILVAFDGFSPTIVVL